MTRLRIEAKKTKYDAEHDVLHVFFPPFAPSVDDEEYPGIFIKRAEDDERITGLVILDFSRRPVSEIRNALPRYDFREIHRKCYLHRTK